MMDKLNACTEVHILNKSLYIEEIYALKKMNASSATKTGCRSAKLVPVLRSLLGRGGGEEFSVPQKSKVKDSKLFKPARYIIN